MQRLADHFGWEWKSKEAGYELCPSKEFTQRARDANLEHALADNGVSGRRARAFRAEWDRIDCCEEARRGGGQLDQELPKEVYLTPPSPKRIEAYLRAIRSSPSEAFANRVVAGMSDADLVEADRHRVVYASDPRGLQRPFTPNVRAAVAKLITDTKRLRTWGQTLPKTPDSPREPLPDFGRVARARVSVRNSYVEVFLLDSEGFLIYAERGKAGIDPRLDQDPFSMNVEPRLLEPSSDERLSLPITFDAPPTTTGSLEPTEAVALQLTSLARQSGVCIVADCFDMCSLVRMEPEQKAREAIDRYCALTGSFWRLKGGWLTIRREGWPYMRAQQLPRSTVRQILKTVEAQGGLTFDQQAQIVAGLTDAQADSPWLQVLGNDIFASANDIFRFWSALSSASKDRLRRGERIEYEGLPGSARRWLNRYVCDVGAMTVPGPIGCGFDGWTVFREPDFPSDRPAPPLAAPPNRMLDFEVTQSFLVPGRPEPSVQLQFAAVPGLWIKDQPDEDGRLALPAQLASCIDEGTGYAYVLGGFSVRYAVVDAHRFEITVAPDLRYRATGTGRIVGSSVPLLFRDFPADLQKRIRAHWLESRKQNGPPDDGGCGGSGDDPPLS